MKEGNVLFNDALNTFCLQLYGVGYNYGKDHSDNKKGNLLSPHGLLFPISSKGSFMCITHSLCYTSRVALAGTRNNSMSPPWWIDLMTHHTMSKRSYHRATSHCIDEKQSNSSPAGVDPVPYLLVWPLMTWSYELINPLCKKIEYLPQPILKLGKRN